MPADRKVTDADVDRLRELYAEGWSIVDLAAEFDVSSQHAGRLARGEQRPRIAVDADAAPSSVVAALEAFLAGCDLAAGDEVHAAAARALAAKLDACSASETVAAAQAAPRVAAQLVDVVERLQGRVPREPDLVDRMRERLWRRRFENAAATAGEWTA